MIAAIESSYVQSLFGGGEKTEAQDARSFSKDGVSSDLQQNSGRDVDMTWHVYHQSTAVHTIADDQGGEASTGLNKKKVYWIK